MHCTALKLKCSSDQSCIKCNNDGNRLYGRANSKVFNWYTQAAEVILVLIKKIIQILQRETDTKTEEECKMERTTTKTTTVNLYYRFFFLLAVVIQFAIQFFSLFINRSFECHSCRCIYWSQAPIATELSCIMLYKV